MNEPLLDNSSATALNEVAGLAVFDGVMMRSRTGFAVALRREDGRISVRQIPFAGITSRWRALRLPVVRGVSSLSEMMVLATRVLGYSSGEGDSQEADSSNGRLGVLIATSLTVMACLLLILPDTLAHLVLSNSLVEGLILGEHLREFSEADQPYLFNLTAGAFRFLILLGYILLISLNRDIREVFQYHGAEHKVVHVLEKNKQVTVDRAREESRLHPRCGTTFLALLVLITIVIYAAADALLLLYVSGYPEWPLLARKAMALGVHLALLPIVIGVAFELVKFAARQERHPVWRWVLLPGLLLQKLTTREPNDHQLEAAIVALLAALAIAPGQVEVSHWTVRGLENDESAPGYVRVSPARPAPPLLANGS